MSMPTPLAWDAEREWGLDIALESSDINLLRDHVTLISDVAKDWSSGSLGDFHHFVPNRYNFRVSLINYAIHLCVNDYNIIDRPRSREDNAFVDFYGSRLDAYVAVAATQYRPEFSVIPFTVKANDVRVELGVPKWDTHRAFGSGNTLEIGKIGQLTASGSYRYYSDPRPDHQETMTLHLEVRPQSELLRLTRPGERCYFQSPWLGTAPIVLRQRQLFWRFHSVYYHARISRTIRP